MCPATPLCCGHDSKTRKKSNFGIIIINLLCWKFEPEITEGSSSSFGKTRERVPYLLHNWIFSTKKIKSSKGVAKNK